MIKVIIAGGREFDDYKLLCDKCDTILSNQRNVEIVCGMARGADLLGKKYAESRGYPVKEFPAEWDKLGKSAGIVRNIQMRDYADALICFWDGKSTGTAHMIKAAEAKGMKIRIIKY
jgi:hypothetical protein